MLVYGDVNSTVAATLVCSKLLVRVGHVEAGLRSFDRTMPEEVNRLVTDQLADLLFTPSEDGDANLRHEGVPAEKIHRVGNVMIDSLVRLLPAAEQHKMNGLPPAMPWLRCTGPRMSMIPQSLRGILESLLEISEDLDIVFPVHPRTRQRIGEFGINVARLHLLEPLPYIEFLALQRRALVVITDSGGIQEETTYLRVPCITLRSNTERPDHRHLGNECSGRSGRCDSENRIAESAERESEERHYPPTLGREGRRTNCPHPEAFLVRLDTFHIDFIGAMAVAGQGIIGPAQSSVQFESIQ